MSLILAISGPSAVGKTTICNRLIAEFGSDLNRVVTATTRSPRPVEKNGVDYFFLTEMEFDQELKKDSFLEYELIHGNKYGVLKKTVLDAHFQKKDILLNIDVNGTASLRKFCNKQQELQKSLKTIFIRPSTLADLSIRIRGRASESEEQMKIRLANAEAEMLREREFDYVLESKDRERDYERVKEIYLSIR